MEENICVGHVVGELINVLVSKGIITQEDLDKEREATIKMIDEMQNKSSQVAGTTSEEMNGITVQVSKSMLTPIYENMGIAEEIIRFSNAKGWSKKQLLLALKMIQSLEHFS